MKNTTNTTSVTGISNQYFVKPSSFVQYSEIVTGCSYPNPVLIIHENPGDAVFRKFRVLLFIVGGDPVAVKTVQPFTGSNPEDTVPVPCNGIHIIIAKAFCCTQMKKCRLRLHGEYADEIKAEYGQCLFQGI